MARLYPMLLFALLVLVVPVESEGQNGQLAKLTEIRLTVVLRSEVKELGLSREEIENQAFVFLSSKLPRLKVKNSAKALFQIDTPLLYMNPNRPSLGFYGSITVRVSRLVTIKTTQREAYVPVVVNSFILGGDPHQSRGTVKAALDAVLTKFAADWYRDNP